MKKLILTTLVAALALTACSKETTNNAADTAQSAAADTAHNAQAVAAEAEAAASATADAVTPNTATAEAQAPEDQKY